MLNRARNRASPAFMVPVFVLALTPARGFEEVWRASFRPSPGGPEGGRIAAGDDAGNLYVAGTARSLDDSTYYGSYTVTLKYAPDGAVLWTRYFHSEFSTRPVSLSVDARGAVYVAASWQDDDVDNRARVFRYDAEGREVWSSEFMGVESDDEDETTADPDA